MTGITDKDLQHFKKHLLYEEKSRATVEKYLRADVNGDGEINVNDSVAIVNGLLA